MKYTVLDYLNCLPDDVRDKAINNSKSQFGDMRLKTSIASMTSAIYTAFHWNKTEEACSYWVGIGNKYSRLSPPKQIEIYSLF